MSSGRWRPRPRPGASPSSSLTGSNPVAVGLVASLSQTRRQPHRGGDAQRANWSAKRLELLHERGAERPRSSAHSSARSIRTPRLQLSDLQEAAQGLGLKLQVAQCRGRARLRCGLCPAGGVCKPARLRDRDRRPFFISRSERLAALTLRHTLPAIFQFRAFAAAGGLMSYGGEPRRAVPPVRHLRRPHSQG